MRRWGFWALCLATVALYFVIILWSLPIISADAGGLAPFDLRPGGYSLEEARAFVAALGEDGRAQYAGAQRWLDIAYPLMLAATLSWAAWRLTRDIPEWVGPVLILLISIGASFDFLENMHVARMLAAGADGLTEELVAAASTATVNKSLLTTVALFGIVGLLIRRWRLRRQA